MVLSTSRSGSVRNIALSALGIIVFVAGVYLWVNWTTYTPLPRTFNGNSSDLADLTILPTLDTPSPDGKSVLWCSSFQLAWNELKSDIVHEPIRIEHAEAECDRLNRAQQSRSDISSDSVYAAAGFGQDGIVDKIKSEMQRRFPGVAVPSLPVDQDGIIAFAHLSAGIKFEHPFETSSQPLQFMNNRGQLSKVSSFGWNHLTTDSGAERVLEQVRVLFATDYLGETPSEFALDLSKRTRPNQIIVAVLKPGEMLQESIARMDRKTAEFHKSAKVIDGFNPEALNHGESLEVPALHWRIHHHFKELEGRDKKVLNVCCREKYVDMAYQDVEFQLDSSGATVSSNSVVHEKTAIAPRSTETEHRPLTHFQINRPFLIFMKKGDAGQPFFVMWVNDAELLMPANPTSDK